MSSTVVSHPPVASSGLVSGVVKFFVDIVAGICEGRELAARYRLLQNRSDAELATLGLRREDIPRAVVSAPRV
jgi:hypothetical protein